MTKPSPASNSRRSPERTAAARAAKAAKQAERRAAPSNGSSSDLAGDLLYGADSIARHLDWPIHRVRHALARGYIPAVKSGPVYIGSKRRLRDYFQGQAEAPEEG